MSLTPLQSWGVLAAVATGTTAAGWAVIALASAAWAVGRALAGAARLRRLFPASGGSSPRDPRAGAGARPAPSPSTESLSGPLAALAGPLVRAMLACPHSARPWCPPPTSGGSASPGGPESPTDPGVYPLDRRELTLALDRDPWTPETHRITAMATERARARLAAKRLLASLDARNTGGAK